MRCSRQFIRDRKSTRLNSSHVRISYAVFCLKKKKHRAEQIVRQHLQINHVYAVLAGAVAGVCRRNCDEIIARAFFFNDTAATEIYTLSLHDALPISTVYT